MKTRIIELQHKTGNKVRLLGICHIGEESYYQQIQNLCEGLVIYEGVKDEHKKLDLNSVYEFISDVIGLKTQNNCIKIKDDWIRSDLDIDTMLFCGSEIVEMAKKAEELLKYKDINFSQYENIAKMTFKLGTKISSLNIRNDFSGVELRNNKVVLDILKYSQQNELVTVMYGDNHLEGIIKSLKKCGYKITSKRKINVF